MLPDNKLGFFLIYTANEHNYNTYECHKLFMPGYNCVPTYIIKKL